MCAKIYFRNFTITLNIFVVSQNHKMTQVGRDIKYQEAPTPSFFLLAVLQYMFIGLAFL
uniref:Uncharacterized protein n=1 Tax=Phasianus colchicus TaxID=9054 RepID=A0A669P6L7_PHACC